MDNGRPARPALSGRALGQLLGVQAVMCTVALALAGSDLPPPRGFIAMVAAAIVLGPVVGFGVPWLLARLERMGVGRTLLAAACAGAVVGVFIVAAMAVRPDLSTIGVTVLEVATLEVVVGSVSAAAAAFIVEVSVLSVRATSRPASLAIALLPTVLVVIPSLIVIGLRLTG
jgi:hypothetical protein